MGHSVTLISTDNLLGSQFFNEFGKPQQTKITPFIDSSFSLGKYKYKTQLGLFVVSKKMVSSTDWRKSRAGWWLGEGGSPCSTGLLRWASLRKWGLNRIVRDEDTVMKTWENIPDWENCCRNGDPLPEPESGLFNTRKWIVGGDTQADKAKDCWKGCPGRKQQAEGTK